MESKDNVENIESNHSTQELISDVGRYALDLTAISSHTLVIKPGVGSLSLGPAELGKKVDLHVAAHAKINWTALNRFGTPAGSLWPRYLYYHGSDSSFFEWAHTRPIEEMTWNPILEEDRIVDASHAQLTGLRINMEQAGGHLTLQLPEQSIRLSLCGDLSRMTVTGTLPYMLTLAPQTGRRLDDVPYLLPDLGMLHRVTNLSIENTPLGQPISLTCLAPFVNLQSLSLWGNFCDLDVLTQHVHLTNLELRFMPYLDNLPALQDMRLLDRFIAYNVAADAGKQLKQQLKARAAIRPWTGYTSVSQLRKPEWWTKEYGRPFASWPKRLAKLANEAYDQAEAALAQACHLSDAEAAITAFAIRFNTMKGIETTEREDIGEAVWQLSQAPNQLADPLSEDIAQQWFDAVRDY